MAQKKERLPDDTVNLCTDALDPDFVRWVEYTLMREEKTLVYKKGNKRGRCYCCGRQVTASAWQKFIQGTHTYCPNCGEEVLCVLSGGASYLADYVCNVAALQKGADGETVFARLYHVRRDADAEYENPAQWIQEIARYAIREDLAARWIKEVKQSYFGNVYQRYPDTDWQRMENPAQIYDGPYKFYPDLSPLEGTRLQYGAAEQYLANSLRPNIIRYLVDLARYPVMEYLVKRGYYGIVDDRCNNMSQETRRAIRWGGKRLKDCFKIPLRLLDIKDPSQWTLYALTRLNDLWQHHKNGEITEADAIEMFGHNMRYADLDPAIKYTSLRKLLDYIDRQRAADSNVRQRDYCDYIRECEQLNLDLTDKQVLFPQNLLRAHAHTTAQIQFKADAEKNTKLAARAAELSKYAFGSGGYFIRPARDMEELIIEGKLLHHCVAGYSERMANGHTAIFFLRRADAPEDPFYTLEYKDGKIVQCRTAHNASYEQAPDIKAFVEEWLEEIAKIDKKKKRKAA